MMKAPTVRCPSCGAPVHPEEDGRFVLCEYCGTKVLLEEDGAPGWESEAAPVEEGFPVRVEEPEPDVESLRRLKTWKEVRILSIALTVASFVLAGAEIGGNSWGGVMFTGGFGWILAVSVIRRRRYLPVELDEVDRRFRIAYEVSAALFALAMVLGFWLTTGSSEGELFWAGIFTVGVLGFIAFSRKLIREFSREYLAKEAALTGSQRMYLNEYRFRVLCAIYAVCVSFVLIPDADSKSVLATVSVILLFAGIVVWVKAGKKAKKIVN